MLANRWLVVFFCGAVFEAGRSPAAAQYCAYLTTTDAVSVLDTSTNAVVARVPVGATPVGVAVAPDNRSIYVANCGASCLEGAPSADTVSVIDTATNAVVATVQVGTGPFLLAVTPNGRAVYVANCGTSCSHGGQDTGNSVSVIDTATNTVTATIPGVGPGAIAITPRDTFAGGIFAYVANWMSDTVSVIDTATNTVSTTITIGDGGVSGGIAITPDGRSAYVVAGSHEQHPGSVIDTATRTVVATVPSMKGGFVTISPNGTRAYAVSSDPSGVAVIDTSSNLLINTVPGVRGPFIAVTPDGSAVYVPSNQDSTVAVINTATSVLSTIAVDGGPFGGIAIASVPGGCSGALCVGDCDGGSTVTVNEILTLVNMALGNGGSCPSGVAASVTPDVAVILRAVNNALNGCRSGSLSRSQADGSNWPLEADAPNLAAPPRRGSAA